MRLAFGLCGSMATIGICLGQGRLLPPVQFASRSLQTNRTVRVYLPPSYDRARSRRFPVLYLHDGQNVFSTAGSNACFGWGGWNLDRTVGRLTAAGHMQETILVAIDNSRSRYEEYRGPVRGDSERAGAEGPQPPAPDDDRAFRAYTAFLIRELKPQIDRTYRTRPGAGQTGVMGASLGGICSLALAWEYPDVFGLAASLSGSFQIERTNFLKHVVRGYAGKPKRLRIYLDSGTIDFTGDDDGRGHTAALAEELRRIGWRDGVDLRHFVDEHPLSEAGLAQAGLRPDKWGEARISQHNEFYWRQRAWRALTFLYPP
jgi:predicted alpha/beta superfamily hydrolase